MIQATTSSRQNISQLSLSFSNDQILHQLQLVLDSSKFNASKLQISFLKFVVDKALSGKSQDIKGYTVATEVFGRKESFDQNKDPVVSIHANKLRQHLERYYLTVGRNDLLRIDIPKGTYVPTFTELEYVRPDSPIPFHAATNIQTTHPWPVIMIRPFKCLTSDKETDLLAVGLTTEIGVEMNRIQEIQVTMLEPKGHGRRITDTPIRFVLDGNISRAESALKVSVFLTDTTTEIQLWGETYQKTDKHPNLISFQEEVARIATAKLASENGVIINMLAGESRAKSTSQLTTYESILRYYEFSQTLDPQSFTRALHALEYSVDIEPECGMIWTMLGRLYMTIYSLELPGFEGALEKAITCAEKGIQLTPDAQRAIGILAFVRMFANQIPSALAEAKKALSLSPNSLYFMDALGHLLTLLGEWEQGLALTRKSIQMNPCYSYYSRYALWLDFMRRGEYEKAYLETQNFTRPFLFWEPLMKAAPLGKLGRISEGKQAAWNLLDLKPDFSSRGLILIGHYIKFDDIFDSVVDGLRKVDVNIT